MDVAQYLDRIGCSSDDLRALHRAHLSTVPFENLSIHRGEKIQLRTEWLFDKIVRRRRGGFCYELNGLFADLLEALGHRVNRLAARVYGPKGGLGPPFDHLCLQVDDEWLCDVGFGDCFVTPLQLDLRGEQNDGRTSFRIEQGDLWMRDRDGTWKREYRFEMKPYQLSDFDECCVHHQTSPDSPFTQKRVVTLLTEKGRVTLRDERMIERIGEVVQETAIDREQWSSLLVERFGISET